MNNRQQVRRTNQDCGLPAALREADRAVARGEEVGLPALLKSLVSKMRGKTERKAPLQPLPEYHWNKSRRARRDSTGCGSTGGGVPLDSLNSFKTHDPNYGGDNGFYNLGGLRL